jgi:hypothetical protein
VRSVRGPYVRLAVIALALAALFGPTPPDPIERHYSNGVYPIIQRWLTWLSNLAPFALFDFLLAALIGWLLWTLARGLSRGRTQGWTRAIAGILARVATAAAVLYLIFLATWGLNYRRVPLLEKLEFDAGAVTPSAARELALTAIREVNARYERAHQQIAANAAETDSSLVDAFARAQRAVGGAAGTRPARPKRTLLDPYFRAAAVEGMTDPYFLETLVLADLLPVERPFVIAHEWSHLAGFADESEANFLGWLTCARASDAARYSGWLFLYGEVMAAVPAADRADIAGRLAPGPRADLRAIADRVRRQLNPVVSSAGWRVYDSYLKANRVDAGTASYAEVVQLVLGTRFTDAGFPKLRTKN